MKNKIIQHLAQDEILKKVLEVHPFPPERAPRSMYDGLLASIISQQLSTRVAEVIRGRFLALFAGAYPPPDRLLSTEIGTLRSVGLSNQKASYLHQVAAFCQRENIHENRWHDMDDEAIIDYLTQIKGVGRWTVQMNLMFTLNRPDVFSPDDLGIQNAMVALYGLAGAPREIKRQMVAKAEDWRPYRSYACWYLWRSLEG